MSKKVRGNSFKAGWLQTPPIIAKDVKNEILSVLEIKDGMQWYRRLRGQVKFNQAEKKAIEEIFANRQIFNIWI